MNQTYNIGFTGSRSGLTEAQQLKITNTIKYYKFLLKDRDIHLLHGDCIGADADMHNIALKLGLSIDILPSNLYAQRAFCKHYTSIAEPDDPLKRNKMIVAKSSLLIAGPNTFKEVTRSGTWSTIRAARKQHVRCYIVFPNGKVKVEDNSE